jgi:hypothetical protein
LKEDDDIETKERFKFGKSERRGGVVKPLFWRVVNFSENLREVFSWIWDKTFIRNERLEDGDGDTQDTDIPEESLSKERAGQKEIAINTT